MEKGLNMKNPKKHKKDKRHKKEKRENSIKKKVSASITGAILILLLLSIAGLCLFTYRMLYRSDYFIVKEARIEWYGSEPSMRPYEALLNTGVGRNIFNVDIDSESKSILAEYPEIKGARITRNFPDRLTLTIEPRLAIAQVGERSFFLVDREGVILSGMQDSIREDLPVISGIGWKAFRKVGQRESSSRMARVLLLLDAANETGFTKNHSISRIDASDYRNVSFFIDDGLEIKIGRSNFKERLGSLERTLVSISLDRDDIKYVDLRFNDVVLGTR